MLATTDVHTSTLVWINCYATLYSHPFCTVFSWLQNVPRIYLQRYDNMCYNFKTQL